MNDLSRLHHFCGNSQLIEERQQAIEPVACQIDQHDQAESWRIPLEERLQFAIDGDQYVEPVFGKGQ